MTISIPRKGNPEGSDPMSKPEKSNEERLVEENATKHKTEEPRTAYSLIMFLCFRSTVSSSSK
jgi:hypothetical protein